jgi:hypothetical protein
MGMIQIMKINYVKKQVNNGKQPSMYLNRHHLSSLYLSLSRFTLGLAVKRGLEKKILIMKCYAEVPIKVGNWQTYVNCEVY